MSYLLSGATRRVARPSQVIPAIHSSLLLAILFPSLLPSLSLHTSLLPASPTAHITGPSLLPLPPPALHRGIILSILPLRCGRGRIRRTFPVGVLRTASVWPGRESRSLCLSVLLPVALYSCMYVCDVEVSVEAMLASKSKGHSCGWANSCVERVAKRHTLRPVSEVAERF